jgi:hypothetical protein
MNNFLSKGMGISQHQYAHVKPGIIFSSVSIGDMLKAPFKVYGIAGVPEILDAGADIGGEVELIAKIAHRKVGADYAEPGLHIGPPAFML